MHIKTFFKITAPMWVIFLFNQSLCTFFVDYFYYHLVWLDIPMHIAGGFAASWTALLFLRHQKVELKPDWLKFVLLIGFTCFASIIWEVYEFYHDLFFKEYVYQVSALDTMADMGDGLIGAILFFVFLYFRKRKIKFRIDHP